MSSRGGTGKTAKSSIVGSQEGGCNSTSTGGSAASKTGKKSKTASTAASKASKKSAPKPQVSEESDAGDDDDVVFVEREGNDGPRHLDPKGRKYDRHYKAVVRDALGGMDLR